MTAAVDSENARLLRWLTMSRYNTPENQPTPEVQYELEQFQARAVQRESNGPCKVEYNRRSASRSPVAMPRTPHQQALECHEVAEGESKPLQDWDGGLGQAMVAAHSVPGPLLLATDGTEVVTWAGDVVKRLPHPVLPRPVLLTGWRRYPITEFAAVEQCPACGDIQVHWLRIPELPQPLPEPEVIRECASCGEEWGQT